MVVIRARSPAAERAGITAATHVTRLVRREPTDDELAHVRTDARSYVELSRRHAGRTAAPGPVGAGRRRDRRTAGAEGLGPQPLQLTEWAAPLLQW
jgi:hypothetical protein